MPNSQLLDQFNDGGTKSIIRTFNQLVVDEKLGSEITKPLFSGSNNFRNGELQLINFQLLKIGFLDQIIVGGT